MQIPIASPRNDYLVPQRDRNWGQVLIVVLSASILVLLALGLVGWPRLKGTSVNYDLIQLRQDVAELEVIERRLSAEVEFERSPARLADRGAELGLAPASSAGVWTDQGMAGE